MPVCTSCGKENPEEARFCLACGSPIAEEPTPREPAEERKLITVVFTDLVGSTARSEQLDPEDVKAMVAPYHGRVRTELERHGGTFEKFSGDAVMALFGAPVAHEDDPERAVRAALAIRDAVAKLNEADEWLDLHIRSAVYTGEALVMLDAHPIEGEWMAAGDVMNTAARLQSAAPVDGIVVGEATHRATRQSFEYRELEPVQAKGKTQPVPVWELVGTTNGAPPRQARRARLVGREAELDALCELWQQVVATQAPALASVLGPPGIGKSRLLAELVGRLEGAAVHFGRCLSYGEGITYWPVIEILKHAAGIQHDDEAETTSLKLGDLLFGLPTSNFDELRTIATALANLVGPPTTPERTFSAREIGQAELHWGIRRLFELLAEDRPVVLVFEDLHWAEPTLIELVEQIGAAAAGPILVIASARPELAEERPSFRLEGPSRHSIELTPLSGDESADLLAHMLGAEAAESAFAAALLRNAGGNPLFLEETVQMLIEDGILDPERPQLPEDFEELRVPESLQALIGARLDRLPGEEKRIAQNASVIGNIFWPGAVLHLEPNGGNGEAPTYNGLDAGLDGLERRDLIRSEASSSIAGEREYAFKHIMIRDVAYGRLPKRRRTVLHVRFADWIRSLPAGEDESVEIVAYHLEQACRLAAELAHAQIEPPVLEAVGALSRAGEKAEGREGFREAGRFYARALELIGDDHPHVATDLRLRRGRMLVGLGDLRNAAEQLAAAADEALAAGRPDVRCAALLALANIDWKQGRAVEERKRLAEAERLAQEIGDRRLEIRTAFELANVRAHFDGDPEAAVSDLRRALATTREIDAKDLLFEAHLRLGGELLNLGHFAEAESVFTNAIDVAGESGSYRDDARATTALSLVKYYRGELDEAEQLALRALDWLERTGDSYLKLQNLRALAKYALARRQPEIAEERLRDAVPLALEAGGWLSIEIYRYLAEALVWQGRVDDAAELVVFAAYGVPADDPYARAALLLAEAMVAAGRNERLSATTSFNESLRLLEEQQLHVELAEARITFARALRNFGELAAARTELQRARATAKGLDASALVAEIDRELAQAQAGAA